MSENFGKLDRVKELQEVANNRTKVIDGAIYAIQEADVLYKIGKSTVDAAVAAVKRDLEEYTSTGPENLADLRNIAQDAAEGIFRELGFDSVELIQDFNQTLNEQLGIEVSA